MAEDNSLLERLKKRFEQPVNIHKTPEEMEATANSYADSVVMPGAGTISKLAGPGMDEIANIAKRIVSNNEPPLQSALQKLGNNGQTAVIARLKAAASEGPDALKRLIEQFRTGK